MALKKNNIKRALVVYWILAVYIVAALIWWFVELSTQNNQITQIELAALNKNDNLFSQKKEQILKNNKSNTAQYLGEGGLFLILIITGATFVIRSFKKEIKSSISQQNFLMAVTHELKTPIAVTKLNLETIQKHNLPDSQYQKILANTLQETERLDYLCNNLLLSSQIEANGYKITKEIINFSELIEDIINGFITRYPNRLFEKQIIKNIKINADNFLLQIAVNNLIDNAIKYSPKDKLVCVKVERKMEQAVLQIIDEGNGITEEERKLIFKKFYRTGNEATKRAKGTGLGLYLTQRIIKAHDGNIAIEDNTKGGSIFVVVFNAIA